VVEESWPFASISSEIAFHLQSNAFDYLDAPVLRVTQTDTPFAFSPTLIEEALPNKERLIDAIKKVIYS
jgi:pyruvate dehydrogenase E1 component beta subunit